MKGTHYEKEKDYFIYDIFYTNFMVTAELRYETVKKKKEETKSAQNPLSYNSRQRHEKNSGDAEQSKTTRYNGGSKP